MQKTNTAVNQSTASSDQVSLADKTQAYWKLMRCWNQRQGKGDPVYTVLEALTIGNEVRYNLNPKRPLAKRMNTFVQGVVNKEDKPIIAETSSVSALPYSA